MKVEATTQQEDNCTLNKQTFALLTYSQMAQKHMTNSIYTNTEYNTQMQEWIQQINDRMEQDIDTTFDSASWNYDRVVTALQSKEGIQEFTKYKMQTKPTNYTLHPAIEAKFRHRDTTFFLTFTRDKRAIPQHQEAYKKLFQEALRKYKTTNAITITDRQTRDQIHQKLRQKIMINFMTNTKFYKMSTKQIYQLIKYYKGFTKDKTIDKDEDLFDSVQEATAALLQQLPDNPDDILPPDKTRWPW